MSILIKDMEMPERCGECFLRVGNCKQRIYMERRPKGCPLVEVKEPHGRLVDLDKMVDEYWDGSSMRIGKTDIKDIEEYDTVIEAEGSEE